MASSSTICTAVEAPVVVASCVAQVSRKTWEVTQVKPAVPYGG